MSTILTISILLIACYLIQQALYIYALTRKTTPPKTPENIELPSVNIYMAARNEETDIEVALQSLVALDYPTDKLEIWIADDQSTDQTPEIIKHYANKYSHLNYYLVSNKFPKIRGKQNALANVIKESSSELIAIVDADIEVKPLWLKELCSYMDTSTSMVCGVTIVKTQGTFTSLTQEFDWTYAAAFFKAHEVLNMPFSGLGNNMLYRRSAYLEIGGYESIKFSVNEDHSIFKVMCEKMKHGYKQVLSYNGTNLSMPIPSFMGTIRQRYRWAKGGADVSLQGVLAFLLPFPARTALLLTPFIHLKIGLTLIALTLILDSGVRLLTTAKTQTPARLYFLPLWYINTVLSGLLIPLCLFFSKKITWRGHKV